jgi:hypothetical protein
MLRSSFLVYSRSGYLILLPSGYSSARRLLRWNACRQYIKSNLTHRCYNCYDDTPRSVIVTATEGGSSLVTAAHLQTKPKIVSGGARSYPLARIVDQSVARAALFLAAVDPSLGVLIAGAHGASGYYHHRPCRCSDDMLRYVASLSFIFSFAGAYETSLRALSIRSNPANH